MSRSTLRVLFFTSRLGGGGAEMQMLRVANHLDPAKVQVHLALARAGGEYEGRLRPGLPVHHLAPALLRSSTLALVASARPLRDLVRELEPDVVCSFMDGVSIAATLALGHLARRPALVACVQNTPTHAYAKSNNPIRRLILALAQRVYPSVDAVVALSHGVANDLVRHVPQVASRVEVIYNAGVDDDLLVKSREPLGEASSRPLVVACGRLVPQKGFSFLIEAFAKVHRETGACLWILGEGPLREQLERQIARLGIGSAVRLMGFQSNPYRFMAAADVFVVPSLWEGFGNVLVEAMATGRPVVASDCPHGPSEIITDGTDGLLVPPADPDALARALRRVLSDPSLARRLGDAARVRSQAFHARAIAAAYAEFFQRVVQRRSANNAA